MMAKDLSHIKMFEVEEDYGSFTRPQVVLFNQNRISLEDAVRHVRAGEYNKNVLVLPKQQWISLFCDGKED